MGGIILRKFVLIFALMFFISGCAHSIEGKILDNIFKPPSREEIEKAYATFPKNFSCNRFNIEKKKVIKEKIEVWNISYVSDGLKIYGMLFKPLDSEKHPLIILGHYGIEGISKNIKTWGIRLAEAGYIVLSSEYRGEGGSEGNIEVARGEVSDVLNLTECGKTLDFVYRDRIGMVGFSHGAWITMLAAEIGDLDVAVIFYGPSDMFSSDMRDVLSGKMIIGSVGEKLLANLQNLPSERLRLELLLRSPIYFVDYLRCPLLLIHDTDDMIISVKQAYTMEKALKEARKIYGIKIYRGEFHGFNFTNTKNATDSWSTMMAFLKKYLD